MVKKAAQNKQQITPMVLVIMDLISYVFSLLPGLIALSLTGWFIYQGQGRFFLLALTPLVLFLSFIAVVFVLRMALPKLKPGRHKIGLSKAVLSWYCHFALGRSAKIIGFTPVLQSINVFKFLYWRALGARVSFCITNAFDIDFVDCPLISIGRGVTLASQTNISCHSDVGNILYLAPVVIEDNVFIAMNNTIGPGTTIKQGAWIGYGNALVKETVAENERLEHVRPTQRD